MEIVYFRWFLPGYFSILCPVQVRRKKSDAWNKIPLTVNNYSIKNISTITIKYLDPNLLSRNVYFIWKKKNVEAWLLIWFTSFWLELTEFQILLSPRTCPPNVNNVFRIGRRAGILFFPLRTTHRFSGYVSPIQTRAVFGLFGLQSWLTSRHVCGHVE